MNIEYNIENNIAFTFIKYGDGEYLCATKCNGHNCDKTNYSKKLGLDIINSYKYLSQLPNTFIGRWPLNDFNVQTYFEKFAIPNWVDYCTFIWKTENEFLNKLNILTAIKNSKQQKIYICNQSMNSLQTIFKIDSIVNVDNSNWYKNYKFILNKIVENVINPESLIIMTSAGMVSKPLIADLRKIYSNAILLDIGSAFDCFVYKKTRDYNLNFSKEFIDKCISLIK